MHALTDRELVDLRAVSLRQAQRLSRDFDDAEDIAQEATARAARRGEFDSYEHAHKWVLTVTRNLFYDLRRRRERQVPTIGYDDLGADLDFLDGFQRTDLSYEMNFKLDEIEDVLAELPDEYSVPVRLVAEGFSYSEIGDVLGALEGTVKSRVSRGRKMARRIVSGETEKKHSKSRVSSAVDRTMGTVQELAGHCAA